MAMRFFSISVVVVLYMCFAMCAHATNPRGVCNMTASELSNDGFKVNCKKGQISSLSVVGFHGNSCQGLTPHLFVQMTSCFWKNNCTLTYDINALNFMIKLFKGEIRDCVKHHPKYFVIQYECTNHKKVKSIHIVRRAKNEGEGQNKVKDKQGVMVSHVDHPFLYERHSHAPLHENLTLLTPKKRFKAFLYTIRSLYLMSGDNLTVEWQKRGKTMGSSVFLHGYDLKDGQNFLITGTDRVVFSLNTSPHTNGGEGFVVCFKWSRRIKEVTNACHKLIIKPKVQCKKKKKQSTNPK